MATLLLEGGFPMWFLLAFGLATLVFAGRFAWSPVRRTLRTTGALALATAMTTLTSICTDLATVGHHAPGYLKEHPSESMVTVLLQGVAESMSPGILGFTILSLCGLLLAVGFHREVVE
jgi:hypothetical protein